MHRTIEAESRRLDSNHPHGTIFYERVEKPDCIGPAIYARNQNVRQAPLLFQYLSPRFASDHRLEVAHDHWIGVRTSGSADQIVSVAHRRDPIAKCFIQCVLEAFAAGI